MSKVTAMSYKLVKTADDLENMISATIKSVKSSNKKVQVCLINIIHHAYLHGDYTGANRLIEGLGNGLNTKAIVEWFVVFGGLSIDEENKEFAGWQGKEYIKANFSAAKEQMWWDLKKQNPFKGWDLDVELMKLVAKAQKQREKLETMSEEDQAKVSFDISGGTAAAIVALIGTERKAA